MRMAGVEDHVGKPLDGVDVLDVLAGERQALDRELLNYIGQEGPRREHISYMTNEWKMIVGPDVTDESVDESARKRFLFRIAEDLAEERDLLAENPELVASMYKKIKWFRALQPERSVPPYNVGRNDPGFQAPPRWRIPGE